MKNLKRVNSIVYICLKNKKFRRTFYTTVYSISTVLIKIIKKFICFGLIKNIYIDFLN